MGGDVKIGWTSGELRDRLIHLQNGNPTRLVLLASYCGTRVQEGDLHWRFRASRRLGEWFAPTPELLACIASIRPSRRWRPRST